MRWWWLAAILLAPAAPAAAGAQGPPGRPAGQAVPTAPTDTGSRDTLGVVRWTPADSVMRALMARKNYTVTRYEGRTLAFDAVTKALDLTAAADHRAAVQRGDQTVITDSTIRYNSNTRIVRVTSRDTAGAGYIIVPGGGQSPIAGRTTATYNLNERAGRINDAFLTVNNSGNTWFVRPQVVKVEAGDSAKNIPARIYGGTATLTSCDDTIAPDYYFKVNEVKRTKNLMVGRPAILYIGDVPVLWLPFFFQDIRGGRHSGMLTPRFGVADIVRNSPTYRRDIENIGWYWALNDYMNAALWLDWRSSVGGPAVGDPGYLIYNGEWDYAWRNEFLSGQIGAAYTRERNGLTELAVNWSHRQQFSRNSSLTANVNYVTSTQLQRQNTFNPTAAMATISSAINYSNRIGPASISLGATRTQYPGRSEIDMTLPSLSISTSPIALASWLTWTPNFTYRASEILNNDQGGVVQRYGTNAAGGLDSIGVTQSSYSSNLSFDTPIQIFGLNFDNAFAVTEQQNLFPTEYPTVYPDPSDTSVHFARIFANTYNTSIDWTPSFSLPSLGHNVLNLTPSVGLQNVDNGPFWVRTQFSGGKFVHQSKRPTFSLSMSPTIYGLFPGVGPFARFRHTIAPQISFSYAPPANVSNAYLAATNQTRATYLGTLAQKAVTLTLNQTFEAKLKSHEDTLNPSAANESRPIKLLALHFSPITYDFERAAATHRALSGITDPNFSYGLTSDLVPGLSVNVGYSLFQGDPISDTAVFKPYRTSVSASFTVSHDRNPFGFLLRMIGLSHDTSAKPVSPSSGAPTPNPQFAQAVASQPVAGLQAQNAVNALPVTQGWSASFNFSSARQRPPVGGVVINTNPAAICAPYNDPNSSQYYPPYYDVCLAQVQTSPTNESPIPNTAAGGPVYFNPPTSSIGSSISLPLTPNWSAAWQTTYNLQQHAFASQQVQLIRELHDWRAIFSFTQSPNGTFFFSFQIALKAEPDLKFNYNRGTYRTTGIQ